MFHQLIKPAIIIFSIMLPLWVIFRLIINSYKKQPLFTRRELLLLTFYSYIIVILLVTVVPIPMTRHASPHISRINYVPIVHTLREFITTFSRGTFFRKILTLENVLGNVVLFFPLGMFLPLLSPRFSSFKVVFTVAFLFSFSIELTQFISKHFGNYRSVDIDDIILNTLGAILGFAIIGKRFARNHSRQ